MKTFALVLLALVMVPSLADAKRGDDPIPTSDIARPIGATDGFISPNPRFAMAAANTTTTRNVMSGRLFQVRVPSLPITTSE